MINEKEESQSDQSARSERMIKEIEKCINTLNECWPPRGQFVYIEDSFKIVVKELERKIEKIRNADKYG